MQTIKLPNVNIQFIKSHKSTNLLGAVGQKTVLFICNKDNFDIKRRFVDENKLELFTCMDFLDYKSNIYAVIGGALGIIKIVDVSTGKFYGYITAHTGLITDIKVYKKFIITSSEDCSIKVWDFESFTRVLVIDHPEVVISLDIREGRILTSCMDQKIREFIDGRVSYCIENIHRELFIKSLYYGKLVVTLDEEGMITIVRPSSNSIISNDCKISDNKISDNSINDNSISDVIIVNDDTPLLILKELYYKGAVNIDIIEHNLLILKDKGLFIIYLPDVLEEYKSTSIRSDKQGVCVTSNKDYIFVLYEESIIEAYPLHE